MPKKQKQNKSIPGEEKAPGLSLADFITIASASKSQKEPNADLQKNQSEQFPILNNTVKSIAPTTDGSCWSRGPMLCSDTGISDIPKSGGITVAKIDGLQYKIGRTKKGGLPIRVENRSKGKKVTVIFNVSGDLKILLSELKHAAGSGGVVKEDTVEIQGDKQEFVEKFLRNKLKKMSYSI